MTEVAADDTAAAETRPRYRLYPQHADYSRMVMEFRPYVMYINQPNYRSKSVNTDEMGFRRQYLRGDEIMTWSRLKEEFEQCDVLVGNSTVFGVDAPSDKATISHYLNDRFRDSAGIPVINLGVRGATSQQELVMFQSMRRFLPSVRRITIFSGIITASTAAFPNSFIYQDFGPILSEVYNFDLFCKQYKIRLYDNVDLALHRFHEWVDLQLRTYPRIQRRIVKVFSAAPLPAPVPDSLAQMDIRLQSNLALFANDMNNWAAIARGVDAKIEFVLQPAISWTRKPLTADESLLFASDMKQAEFHLDRYATPEFHKSFRGHVSKICDASGIPFYDANEWLDETSYRDMTIFSDVCHLTEAGARAMAQLLRQKLV